MNQVISTLGDALESMSRFAGGSVPPTNDVAYASWVSWIAEGQEDASQRGFWNRLLIPTNITITKDVDYVTLPSNFQKKNGLYLLIVDGVDWAQHNNPDGQKLFVNLNPDTAQWQVNFIGFTPTVTTTAKLWYFYQPPTPTEETDALYLDGKMIVFYALTEYFRQSGELGSLDDARSEYNNRFSELLGLEVIPSPQELLSWQSYETHLNVPSKETRFYSGRGRYRR